MFRYDINRWFQRLIRIENYILYMDGGFTSIGGQISNRIAAKYIASGNGYLNSKKTSTQIFYYSKFSKN